MTDELFQVTTELAERFGPLTLPSVKPYSASLRTADQKLIIKIYRGIQPLARQRRELEALAIAPTFGIAVPYVVDHGDAGDTAWTAFEVITGGTATAQQFPSQAGEVMATLHRFISPDGAGPGWTAESGAVLTNSDHLAQQLTVRARSATWWPTLAEQLCRLDDEPSVYLHGDLKPEHLIVTADRTSVVDWEACSRGPAASDHADVIFHLLRDLIYADRPTADVAAARSPGLSVALAWRLVLWTDRRRPKDLDALPVDAITDLTSQPGEEAVETAVVVIRQMRGQGTPP